MLGLLKSRAYRAAAGLAAAAILFLAYSFLPLTAPDGIAASPDENANRVFAERFADEGVLYIPDAIALHRPNKVVPRSVRIADDLAVPVGFIGLPVLFGGVAKGLGHAVIPFVTPLLAVLAVFAWGALVTRHFGARVGFTAGALLAVQPVWWYESARTLMPNVAFCAFTIFGLYFLFASPLEKGREEGARLLKHADAMLGGAMLGLALAIRGSEVYWYAVVVVTALAVARLKNVPWTRLIIAAVTCFLILVPFLMMNDDLYGDVFASGYGSGVDVSVGALPHGLGDRLLGPLRPVLFPLGFAPRTAIANFWTYGIGLVPWWSWLVLCAFAAAGIERWRAGKNAHPFGAGRATFVWSAAALSLWLVLFYGSWSIRDNPDPSAVTIGSSYLRYWLPVFVVSTIPVGWLIVRSTAVLRRNVGSTFAAILLLVAGSAAFDVFNAPQEGLLPLRESLRQSEMKKRVVLGRTTGQDVIVVDRADKFLWPDRHVMVGLRDESTYEAMGYIKNKIAGLYYFGITLPEKDVQWLNDTKLPPLGLSIAPVVAAGDETLYKFTMVEAVAPAPDAKKKPPNKK